MTKQSDKLNFIGYGRVSKDYIDWYTQNANDVIPSKIVEGSICEIYEHPELPNDWWCKSTSVKIEVNIPRKFIIIEERYR